MASKIRLAHYNSPDSVNGQWYVFIADETGELIGHYDPKSWDRI